MMRNINVGCFKIGESEKQAINEVLVSGKISEDKKVFEFEKQWANFIGRKYCVLVNSGTSALIAGLEALKHHKEYNIKEGNSIITSPLTYIATTNAIVKTGFNPLFVDVDMDNFCITPEKVKEFIEKIEKTDDFSKCSIILPVHLMGFMSDMDRINKIAKENNMITFEDAAQAHGSIMNGKKAGANSLLSDFSFYIAHNVQAGEMGAIVTDDFEIYKLIKKIKANGRECDCPICTRTTGCPRLQKQNEKNIEDYDPRFSHELIGYNFKTMEFQAALGLSQLKKVDEIIRKRQENVKYLNEGLACFSDIIKLPTYSTNVSYLAYPLVIKKPEIITRKELRDKLEKKGIETRPLFGSIPNQQKAYEHLKNKFNIPNADYLGKNAFYIGVHQYLTQEDLDYIIKVFRELLK